LKISSNVIDSENSQRKNQVAYSDFKKEIDDLLRELGREEKYQDEIEYIENKAGANKPKIS